MNFLDKKKGFTLIELLVVISIISLLSSVILAALHETRVKAQNSVAMQDIKQYINVFHLYTNDSGGVMPDTGGSYVCLGHNNACDTNIPANNYVGSSPAGLALLDEKMKNYINNFSNPIKEPRTWNGYTIPGVLYKNFNTTQGFLLFFLMTDTNTNCGFSAINETLSSDGTMLHCVVEVGTGDSPFPSVPHTVY